MEGHRQSAIAWVAGLAWVWFMAGAPAAQTRPASSMPDRISIEEFRTRYAAGAVYVIDVRGPESFKAGHIPGAINVPLNEIESRAGEIRRQAANKLVVTYCSCPDEHASLAAVKLLAGKGVVDVRALVGGYPAWLEKTAAR